MPEYPDLTLYLEAIDRELVGQSLDRLRIISPFVLRTHDPAVAELAGARLISTRRLGKRLVLALDRELFVVVHLMIAGRLRLKEKGAAIPRKVGLAAFDFERATLLLTEASPKKRASIHIVRGEPALASLDPGGLEPLSATPEAFAARLRSERHTLKRALCDPHLFAAIGNAYSDEILHEARLSPVQLTKNLDDGEVARLFAATQAVLARFTDILRKKARSRFPEKVTAFHDEMAVHGKYGQPCAVCGTAVQRIRRADNEVNYCARCQTGGKLLADRSLSRLLHEDWPETLEELEEMKRTRRNTSPLPD